MKELFFEFYPIEEEQIKQIWKKCLFSYDTNVLLNFYRYTDQTRKKFFEVIEKLGNRNMLTYHTALEFHRNRLHTISGQTKAYDSLSEFLTDKFNQIETELNQYKKHTYIQSSNVKDQFDRTFKRINKNIAKLKTNHPDLYKDDQIRNQINKLFKGKVTDPYDEDRLSEIYKKGKIRYEKKIPPGYEDYKNKKDNEENSLYGDLIIWNQVLDLSKKRSLPIVFVTDDLKEDWWYRYNGKTIGPRPELIKEFNNISGQQILIYNADSFLNYASQFTGVDIDKTITKEIKELLIKDDDVIRKNIYKENLLNSILKYRDDINHNIFLNNEEIYSTFKDEKYNKLYDDKYVDFSLNNKLALDNLKKQLEDVEFRKRMNILSEQIKSLKKYRKDDNSDLDYDFEEVI